MQVGKDPRPVMREAYNMFKNGGDPEKVWFNAYDLNHLYGCLQSQGVHLTDTITFNSQLVAAFSNGQENEKFYASLYAGLYYESEVCSQLLNLPHYFGL